LFLVLVGLLALVLAPLVERVWVLPAVLVLVWVLPAGLERWKTRRDCHQQSLSLSAHRCCYGRRLHRGHRHLMLRPWHLRQSWWLPSIERQMF